MASKRIGRDEVRKVAQLARLELTEDEVDRFAAQLAAVLEHVARLDRVDTSDVPPTADAFALTAPLREDQVRPGLSQAEALATAPAHEDGAFVVPRILGAGKGSG